MMAGISKERWLEVVRFGITGVISTVVDLGAIYAAEQIGWGPNRAVSAGYALGVCVNFLMHKYFTFRSRQPVQAREIVMFAALLALNYGLTLLIVNGVLFVLPGVGTLVAKIISIPFIVVSTYTFNRRYVFIA